MTVLCLSREAHWLRHVSVVFADSIGDMAFEEGPEAFLQKVTQCDFDALVIDIDVLPPASSPFDFVSQIESSKPKLVMGSRFADWHEKVSQGGIVVLQKPTSAGEVGLALRRLVVS
jgi:hypothetical protein